MRRGLRGVTLAELMGRAEHEVLACMNCPWGHWPQIHSTNPLEQSDE